MVGTTSGVLMEISGDDLDIILLQGKTVSFTVTWGGSAPIDITGYTARMKARKDPTDDVGIDFTIANGRITMGTTNGLITISMTATDTAALALFDGYYDLELITPAGAVYQVMSGRFRIVGEATR